LVAAALLAAGCGDITIGDDATKGELGVAEFAWDEGLFGCLFGCDAEEPMAVGAVANLVVVNDEELPVFTVESDDASTIQFTLDSPGDNFIEATAHREGTAKVILLDARTDEVIDRLAVDAYDVASIELRVPDLYRQRYTIMVGGEAEIHFILRNSRDQALKGIGAVDYTLQGGITEQEMDLVSAMAEYIVSIFAGTVSEYVDVTANELGTGSLLVSALTGVTMEIPVAIVDESAATAIELVPRGDLEAPGAMIIDAFVWAGDEPLHSAACQWSLNPPDGPVQIDWESRDVVQLKADTPGQAQLTCQIGSLSESAPMNFR
jgi:hypothetical protein